MMSHKYSDCYHCGGQVVEQCIAREVWWQDKLHLIENVPVGVCQQCGQKVVHADVAKVIDQILSGTSQPDSFVRVPAYQFPDTEQVV